MEKKVDGKYTIMFWANPGSTTANKEQLYKYLPPISLYIQLRQRHAGYCWRSKDKLISDVPLSTYISLHRHRMLSRVPASNDGWLGWIARETQGNLFYQHDLMIISTQKALLLSMIELIKLRIICSSIIQLKWNYITL